MELLVLVLSWVQLVQLVLELVLAGWVQQLLALVRELVLEQSLLVLVVVQLVELLEVEQPQLEQLIPVQVPLVSQLVLLLLVQRN